MRGNEWEKVGEEDKVGIGEEMNIKGEKGFGIRVGLKGIYAYLHLGGV